MSLTPDSVKVHDLDALAKGYPWKEWDLLRREAPVHWYAYDDVEPFWAITKHEDVLEISKRSDIFINGGPRLRFILKGETEALRYLDPFGVEQGWNPNEPSDFVFLDDPRHKAFRSLVSRSFTPGRLKESEPHFLKLAQVFTAEFERALAQGPQDLVSELSVKLPLAAIGEMFDLPADDWRQILLWTNAMTGNIDPAFERAGEELPQASQRGLKEFRQYLKELVEHRRSDGANRDRLLDQIVTGRIDGEPLTEQQLNGYLVLLIAAGNETTRNATTGGAHALLENPDQLRLFCDHPELLDSVVEEILRWTSPVYHFFRTAAEDYELRGVKIRAGETVGMFYPSANRDEDVFPDPYRFDIARDPNPHLAFGGYGAHFCLGANLARTELRAALTALRPLLPRLELAGEPIRNPNLHVPGYRSLPVKLTASVAS
jgi:cholest-4-en-3-one 26-monooxygenase